MQSVIFARPSNPILFQRVCSLPPLPPPLVSDEVIRDSTSVRGNEAVCLEDTVKSTQGIEQCMHSDAFVVARF